ncbi:hypothetical protein ASZ90_016915 [hydrocarbon metagenome]|uniref:Uncharacterized protein n=1 Tax=hydrocarbon metagenome TaxID=938273 RepID=A0A0W8EAH1_9ZZZZ
MSDTPQGEPPPYPAVWFLHTGKGKGVDSGFREKAVSRGYAGQMATTTEVLQGDDQEGGMNRGRGVGAGAPA